MSHHDSENARRVAIPQKWNPKFLCRSFKSPIVLSDGTVTSCTLDHKGRNRLGSIFENDFESLITTFGTNRLLAMANPRHKPMCHSCYLKLPRWQSDHVPRSGWINDTDITEQQKVDYLQMFDPDHLTFNIELSSACNLRCIGCPHADPTFSSSRKTANIDMDQLMAWLNGHIHRIDQVRLYHMGETWLHPRWLEFCHFLKESKPDLNLFTSTNGQWLNCEDKLRQVIDSGINHVMFSIHGTHQVSAEAYMGKTFRINIALDAARQLIEMRGNRSIRPYVSWKYLLFEWNDSQEEIEDACRLVDEVGFDEIHFTITSQPAPSKRYIMGSEAWTQLRAHCASLSTRASDYQRYTPMEAVYMNRRHRKTSMPESDTQVSLPSASVSHSNPLSVPATVPDCSSMLETGKQLLEDGRVFDAVRELKQGVSTMPQPPAAMHKLLGDSLLAAGQAEEAINAYETSLSIDPNPTSEWLHLGLARSLRAVSRFAQASAAYEVALHKRAVAGGRAYGEDIYLELRDVNLAIGNTDAAAIAYQYWIENSYLIERESRVIYCPIAKNASTFLKKSLVLNSSQARAFEASGKDAHVYTRQPEAGFRLGDQRPLSDRQHFSFVVLRNPIERIIRAYLYIFVRPLRWRPYPDLPGRDIVRQVHLRNGQEPNYRASINFETFVHHLVDSTDAEMDHHWRPQTSFFTDINAFDLVGCVEQLSVVMAEISRRFGWTFPSDDPAARNTLRCKHLKPDQYHRMAPHELSSLPTMPTSEQLLTEELHNLLTKRYTDDIALYRSRFSQLESTTMPVYPTGGALSLHHEPSSIDSSEPLPSSANQGLPQADSAPTNQFPASVSASLNPLPGDVLIYTGPEASADGLGTRESPMALPRAIRAALAAQANGSPARLVLLAGIYREQVSARGSAGSTAPITIEADAGAIVILSGADVWTDWEECHGIWHHRWPFRWGLSSVPPDYGNPFLTVPELMRRREMLIVNGVIQRQVLDPAQLVPGTYYVDEDGSRLSLRPAPDVDITSAMVEVATRSGLMHFSTVNNLRLRGLGFCYDASHYFIPQTGALRLSNCSDVLVEDCQAYNNNNKGVQIDGKNSKGIVLRRVAMNRNGCLGLLAYQTSNLRIENCDTSFNNWRGNWSGFYRGSPCGMKVMRSNNVHIVGHRALRNLATGIWIDEDNHHVKLESTQVYGNFRGVHVEASTGPVTIIDCSIVDNRQEPIPSAFRWAFGSGIAITHARHVTVEHCFLSGNNVAQIGVRSDRPTRTLQTANNDTPRELFTADLQLRHNTIVADIHSGWLRVPDEEFDGGRCFASLHSDNNHFISSQTGQDLYLANSTIQCNTHRQLTLAEWQKLTNNDGGSRIDGHN